MHPDDPHAGELDLSGPGSPIVATNHGMVDGDLITGQNQDAGLMVAREMMPRVLAKREAKEKPTPT